MKRSSFIYSLFFSVFSISFLLMFVFDDNVFAKDFVNEVIIESDQVNIDLTDKNSDVIKTRGLSLPNGVGIKVIPSVTAVTINAENYGVDTVDSVTIKMSTPNYYGKKGKKTKTVTFTKLDLPLSSRQL